jgi:hypothetical protein
MKVSVESLTPGDLWFHGQKSRPWILLSKKVINDTAFPEFPAYELTWFGSKTKESPETIVDCWTRDSKFLIHSRVERR